MDKDWRIRTGEEYKKRVKKLEWLWEPLLLKDAIAVLIADGGIGKSGFSLWLADQLCGLGKTVVYLELEGFGGGIVERLETWNLPNHHKILFPVCELTKDIDISVIVTRCCQIEELIQTTKPDLLIIDSLTALAQGKDINNYSVASDLFGDLAKMTDRHKVAILVLAHTNKNTETISVDSMRGSGSMRQVARTNLTLENAVGSIDVTRKRLVQWKTNVVGKISTVTFTMNEEGISDYYVEGEEENKREEGTFAAKCRAEAIRQLTTGKNKEETRLVLKELRKDGKSGKDAIPSSEEIKRAIKYASEKLNITWEG